MSLHDELKHYLSLGLTLIPLKFRYKRPLVRWVNGWNPSIEQLQGYLAQLANDSCDLGDYSYQQLVISQ